MRVLFLDFDGVLNHAEHFKRLPANRTAEQVAHDDESFDPACVERVNTILRRTGAVVVVSSSWRHMYPAAKLGRILTRHGFAFRRRLVGVTPDFPRGCRGNEIQAWLDGHRDVDAFAILDDDADMGHLAHRLVRTTFAAGLTDEHMEQTVRLLSTPSPPSPR